MGFSRQEHWSGLPFPSPMHESEAAQSCPTLSDPMDCSPPGSSIHGIFQARVLEWSAIAFSGALLYQNVKMQISCPHFFHFKCKMLDIGTLLHAGKDKDAVELMETEKSEEHWEDSLTCL